MMDEAQYNVSALSMCRSCESVVLDRSDCYNCDYNSSLKNVCGAIMEMHNYA